MNKDKLLIEALAKAYRDKIAGCECELKTLILKSLLELAPPTHVLAVWRHEIFPDMSIERFRNIIDKLVDEGYISLGIVGEDNHCNVFPHLTSNGRVKAVTGFKPCPTCAPLRKLEKELCWKDGKEIMPVCQEPSHEECYSGWICESCGQVGNWNDVNREHRIPKIDNPDLTTKLHITDDGPVWYLRYLLESVGLWDKFMLRHFKKALYVKKFRESSNNVFTVKLGGAGAIADILTNGLHLRDAVGSFMEGINTDPHA